MITDYTSFLIGTNTEAVQRAVINDAISSEVKLLQFYEGRELFNLLISSITSIMCQIHWIYVPPTEPTTLFVCKVQLKYKIQTFFCSAVQCIVITRIITFGHRSSWFLESKAPTFIIVIIFGLTVAGSFLLTENV